MTTFTEILTALSELESIPTDALDQLRDCIKNNFNIDLDN